MVGGTVAAALVFAFCYWASTWPGIGPASLTWSFRPWWRESNWGAAIISFGFVATLLGFLAACRPEARSKR